MDKIYHSDKPYCTATSGACGLYRNPMLCKRPVGRTEILLKENGQLNCKELSCFIENLPLLKLVFLQ